MDDLIKRLRGLARHEHSDMTIGDEAADALEAARWQPIKTAPKDSRGILGFINPMWQEGIFWNGEEWSYLSDGDTTPKGRHQPTHWMPLPALPKEARNG